MKSVENTLVWRALTWEQFSMKSPGQRHQIYAMAFPRSVETSLVENARPAKHYLTRAKRQRENELVHVRPTLQLASPGCCEKVSAKLLHLHRQNQKMCLCPKQSLSQKKIPGKDPGKSRTDSVNASRYPVTGAGDLRSPTHLEDECVLDFGWRNNITKV